MVFEMNKAIIFDLDGTLIHSLPDILEHINITLQKYNAPLRNERDIRQFIGNGARKLVERSFGQVTEEELDERLAFYNKSYTNSGSPNTRLFDGVKELLLALKERGYKLAILTNKPQITTEDVYKKYLSRYEFDKVVGQSANVKCKPDKEAVLWILKDLNVLPENTYFVGDGETDVMVANNAELKGIAALWGYRDREILEQYGAKIFAKSPLDLLNLID
jgi:phosphoglycolate phosphatase